MRFAVRSAVFAVILLAFAAPAVAVAPVYGDVGGGWWFTDLTINGPHGATSDGSGGPVLQGSVWFTRFGFRAAVHGTDGVLSNDAYASVDLAYKPIVLSRNSYVALAVGYQENDFHRAGGGLFGTTEKAKGVRLAAEARASLVGLLYTYAEGAWFPSLGSIGTEIGGEIKDLSGHEYEFGIGLHPIPLLFIRLGYRDVQTSGDTIELGADVGETKYSSKGFVATVDFQF